MTNWSVSVSSLLVRAPLTAARPALAPPNVDDDVQSFDHTRLDFVFAGIIVITLVGVASAVITLSGKIQDTVKWVVIALVPAQDRTDILSRSTKASLNDKGVNLTTRGISVRTDKQLDREAYLDATQRGAINVIKAASFGAPDAKRSLSEIDKHIKEAPDKPLDHTSTKKRSIFGKSKK